MGSFNSGRRATTPDTDDCLRLSLPDLRRVGVFQRGHWTRLDLRWTRYGRRQEIGQLAVVACVACEDHPPHLRILGWAFGQPVDQYVQLVAQPQPYGGERYFALCPITGQQCTVLFLPPRKSHFASARGWKVPHASTREREVARAYRALSKVEGRMGQLSKYTRRRTHDRMAERWERAHDVVYAYEARLVRWW